MVDFLKEQKATDLIIIPDGQLNRIPFETLLTEDYNEKWTGWNNSKYFSEMPFLIKKYNISYFYSLNLWVQTQKMRQTSNDYDWIGFASVFDDESISGTTEYLRQILEKNLNSSTRSFLNGYYITPLPGSKEEVMSIYDMFNRYNKKAIYKSNSNANESSMKSEELKKFNIIHLATHGKVDEKEPRFSFILFAQDTTCKNNELQLITTTTDSQNEGFLYQSEIFQLKLNANLVVLSACETGLGQISQGEGLIGVSRAFLYAGAKKYYSFPMAS
jgi:CHAT domain-containing protein